MAKAYLVDTSRCIACKACQVACKQWNGLPAEKIDKVESPQNPPDLSAITWTLVRMKEAFNNGKVRLLFFKDQCRHCIDPPCQMSAIIPGSIYKDEETGAVIYAKRTKYENFEDIMCPYDIPREDPKTGRLFKCTMCIDRVKNNMLPACVQACPTGAMQFGDREEILKMAHKRLEKVKTVHKNASLVDEDEVSTIYLLTEKEELYGMTTNLKGRTVFA